LLGEAPERVAPEVGERLPDLLLEEDDDGEGEDDQEALDERLEGREVEELGEVVDDADEDEPEDHLHGAGAADEEEEGVDDDRHRQDGDGVCPGDDLHDAREGHPAPSWLRALRAAIAPQTARSSAVGPTSWTRTTAAPSAA